MKGWHQTGPSEEDETLDPPGNGPTVGSLPWSTMANAQVAGSLPPGFWDVHLSGDHVPWAPSDSNTASGPHARGKHTSVALLATSVDNFSITK